MTVDIKKIKQGDKITVELVVFSLNHSAGDEVIAGPINNTGRHYIKASTIVAHTPKPKDFVVGDKITYKSYGANYEFRGFIDRHIGYKFQGGPLQVALYVAEDWKHV